MEPEHFDAIVLGTGEKMTGITYAKTDFPKTDYEVALEGKRVEVKGWRDAAVARQKIAEAAQAFEDAKEKKDKKVLEAVGAGKK